MIVSSFPCRISHRDDRLELRKLLPIQRHLVVQELPCRLALVSRALGLHPVEELLGARIAHEGGVLEYHKPARAHEAPGSGAVIFEHILHGFPEECEVLLGEACLLGELRKFQLFSRTRSPGAVSLSRSSPGCNTSVVAVASATPGHCWTSL